MNRPLTFALAGAFASYTAACDASPARDTEPAAPPAVDTGRVAVAGGSLYYEVTGTGPVVVLLHGGNLDRRMWDEQFTLFARTHRVIRYDARGFGRSSLPDSAFAAHDDLAALLRALDVPKASLVGLSLGGRIAMDFALANPSMVDRLVLAAPGISGGKWADDGDTLWVADLRAAYERGDSVGVALAWLKSGYINTAVAKPELAPRLRAIATDQARLWMALIRGGNKERDASPTAAERLEQLTPPTLLLVGDRDTPFIADVARAITARAPNVRRVDFPGIGHMINLEAPARFNDEVLSFLASRCPPKRSCD